tara:strand:+ start:242 stop:1096 length:855 start_codon:yes stop_codon:yes gene_type:complete
MKKLKSYSWLLLLFALLACTKEIDFELSDESTNRLVVEANFTNAARQHEVKLTRTSTFYEPNETPAETGARVTIVGNNQTVLFDEVRPGVYLNLGMDSGQIGQTYTLQIELANGERYTASETMMRNTVIDSMSYEYFSFASLYNVNIWTQEPAGKGDSYLWNVYINGNWINDTLRYSSFQNDDFVDGSYVNGGTIYQIRERSFLDYSFNPPLKLDSIRVGVETVNVSQNFFEFVVTALLETEFRGTPFDGPPANIRGNISDGALGYFSVTSVSNRYEFTILTEH